MREKPRLGAGRSGAVYLADDETTQQRVAIKVLARVIAEARLDALREEFRSLSSLHHRQIARAFDFGFTGDGRPYYTREYVEGKVLASGPPPRRADARAFLAPFIDILDALDYLHANGILHLDVHAGNVIEATDADRGSVLIDFGAPGSLIGSRSSPLIAISDAIAPEILRGENACPATDLFAVSRLLLYRLTGSRTGASALPHEIPGWGSRLTLMLERIRPARRGPRERIPARRPLLPTGRDRDRRPTAPRATGRSPGAR